MVWFQGCLAGEHTSPLLRLHSYYYSTYPSSYQHAYGNTYHVTSYVHWAYAWRCEQNKNRGYNCATSVSKDNRVSNTCDWLSMLGFNLLAEAYAVYLFTSGRGHLIGGSGHRDQQTQRCHCSQPSPLPSSIKLIQIQTGPAASPIFSFLANSLLTI